MYDSRNDASQHASRTKNAARKQQRAKRNIQDMIYHIKIHDMLEIYLTKYNILRTKGNGSMMQY